MKNQLVKLKRAKTTSTHLATALLYGENGLLIVPLHGLRDGRCTCGRNNCKQPGRHPRIDDATSKRASIKEYWTQWPKAKIAIATGAPDIIALTVTGNDGRLALKKHGTPATTVEFRAGESRTSLFKAPADAIPDGTVRIAKGVIVRGRGKYVTLPNDPKVSEGRHFVSGRAIGQTDIAPAPDWLLALLRPHLLGIHAKPPSPGAQKVRFKTVTVDINCIVDENDPCDPEQVKRRVQSISETGPRMPPAVRLDGGFRDDLPLYSVLTDRCQVEALKSLGATHVDCILVDTDEDGAVVWQLAESFNQPQTTVLERAELAMQCVEIVRQKAGHIARPRGGRQANDKGLGTTERILGVSRRDLGRFEKIAGISAKAKEEARRAGLDDNQNALLEIAQVSAEKQVQRVRELEGQYAGGRRKPSAPAKSKKSTKKTRVDTKEGPDDAEAADGADDAALADDAEDDAEATPDQADSPALVPPDDGLGLPPILRRTDVEKQYEDFEARWEQYCGAAFAALPAAMQSKFASELLGKAVIAAGKGEGSR